jgi:hypothetical protein
VPTTPAGRLAVVRASDGLTTICILALAVLAGVEESETVTVKLYVVGLVLAAVRFPEMAAPGAVGVPEMTPVEVSRVKPAGKVPVVTAHV